MPARSTGRSGPDDDELGAAAADVDDEQLRRRRLPPVTPRSVSIASSSWSRTWSGASGAALDRVDERRGVGGPAHRLGADERDRWAPEAARRVGVAGEGRDELVAGIGARGSRGSRRGRRGRGTPTRRAAARPGGRYRGDEEVGAVRADVDLAATTVVRQRDDLGRRNGRLGLQLDDGALARRRRFRLGGRRFRLRDLVGGQCLDIDRWECGLGGCLSDVSLDRLRLGDRSDAKVGLGPRHGGSTRHRRSARATAGTRPRVDGASASPRRTSSAEAAAPGATMPSTRSPRRQARRPRGRRPIGVSSSASAGAASARPRLVREAPPPSAPRGRQAALARAADRRDRARSDPAPQRLGDNFRLARLGDGFRLGLRRRRLPARAAATASGSAGGVASGSVSSVTARARRWSGASSAKVRLGGFRLGLRLGDGFQLAVRLGGFRFGPGSAASGSG